MNRFLARQPILTAKTPIFAHEILSRYGPENYFRPVPGGAPDIKAMDELFLMVLEVYEALITTDDWDDTLLVVVYDEHGGFYDHVPPPPLDVDDGSPYATYGVRVPALVIGPRVRVKDNVSHQQFDHTSLIKTILLQSTDPDHSDEAIKRMGPRVEHAQHLGVLLDEQARDDIPAPTEPRAQIDAWRARAKAKRRGTKAGASLAPDGAGRPLSLHDFQEEFVRFALAMRATGLRNGEP